MPSGFGGDFVPGPPRFCQSSQDPRYSPMFIYLPYESVSVLCLFVFQFKKITVFHSWISVCIPV